MTSKLTKIFFSVFFLVLAFSAWQKTEAASPSALSEDQIKAAYIYNFAKFVQWPESAFVDSKNPLRICTAGSEALFRALESLQNKTVQGRPLKISRYSSNEKPPTHKCHILFIGKEHKKQAWEKRKKRIIPHVLTIADFDSFVSQGGIIEFIVERSKIRFAVNNSAANRADIKLSSKLLKLAIFVKE